MLIMEKRERTFSVVDESSVIIIDDSPPSNFVDDSSVIIIDDSPPSNFVDESSVIIIDDSPPSNFVDESSVIVIDDSPPSNSISKPMAFIDLTKGPLYSVRAVNPSEMPSNSGVSRKRKRPISFPPKMASCDICADEKLEDDMFTIVGCDHSYCSDCVSKYVDSKMQESILKMGCPFPGCKGSLDPQSCQSILPKKVFDRWCDALCESLIDVSEKLYCPYKDCSALLIDARFEEEGCIECECPECHRFFCSGCKVPWHTSLTCEEYQKLRDVKDEKLLMDLAKKKRWMRCPRCRFYVQRSAGCTHMKCRCGQDFCYKCGGPFGFDLSSHRDRCKRKR